MCLVTNLLNEVTSFNNLKCPIIGKDPEGLGRAAKGFIMVLMKHMIN